MQRRILAFSLKCLLLGAVLLMVGVLAGFEGCEPDKDVKIFYKPLLNFACYKDPDGNPGCADPPSIVTIYKITKIANTGKAAEDFVFRASNLFVTPNEYYDGVGWIEFSMSDDASFYFVKPSFTHNVPAGSTVDFAGGQFDQSPRIVISIGTAPKANNEYKNGAFEALWYSNKDNPKGQLAFMELYPATAKAKYFDTVDASVLNANK